VFSQNSSLRHPTAGRASLALLAAMMFNAEAYDGTHPETDPPRYVRNLAATSIAAFDSLDWIDAGLDFRERIEFRHNDLRRPFLATDENFLHRTRAYFGIREILDPFRFAVEFEDSRASNSEFAEDTRDFNKYELI